MRKATFNAFNEAWDLLWSDSKTWALSMLVFLIASYAIELPVSIPSQLYLQAFINDHPTMRPFELFTSPMYLGVMVAQAIAGSFAMPFATGYARMGLRAFRGQQPDLAMVFQLDGRYWSLVLYWLLHQMLLLALTCLLVIPGIVFFTLMLSASLLVLERRMDPVDAMKLSGKTAWPSFWPLFGVVIVSSLAGAMGIIACCVGALFTMPVIYLAQAAVYRQLFEGSPSEPCPAPPIVSEHPRFEP